MTVEERIKCVKALIRVANTHPDPMTITKGQLFDAVTAMDNKLTEIQGDLNAALPVQARSQLTLEQKVILFTMVMRCKYEG